MTKRTSLLQHQFRRRIEFSDTDAAGVAHFTRLLSFIEEAEHALFHTLQIPVLSRETGWPRAGLEIRYLAPCRFGETLLLELDGFETEDSFLSYQFAAGREVSASPPQPVLRGTMRICFAKFLSAGSFQKMEIPGEVLRKLGMVG